ncbi:hypothetical protein NBRC116493_18600 [Aurantivibrio infirmus]
MSSTDPYSAPQSSIAQSEEAETYQPQFLSLSGRIGRLRYIAYGAALNLIYYGATMVISFIAGFLGVFGGNGEPSTAFVAAVGLVFILGIIPIMIFGWGYMVRRLNDMNMSGWLSLLMIIPFVNLILAIMLLFFPGTKSTNDYGPQPNENNTGIYILSLVVPVFMIIFVVGILAAVAIPAYQDYVQRAAEFSAQ